MTAITELEPLLQSEENSKGLIPVAMSKFVSNNEVNLGKLEQVLSKVEASWQKRQQEEENREKRGDWRGKLGQRVSWPMSEMD